MEVIGKRFKELRLEQGYSMEKLAAKAGCSYKSVINIEKGLDVTTSVLSRFLKVLGYKLVITKIEEK